MCYHAQPVMMDYNIISVPSKQWHDGLTTDKEVEKDVKDEDEGSGGGGKEERRLREREGQMKENF